MYRICLCFRLWYFKVVCMLEVIIQTLVSLTPTEKKIITTHFSRNFVITYFLWAIFLAILCDVQYQICKYFEICCLTRSMKRHLQFIYVGSRRCHEIQFWHGSVIFTCFQTIINNYHLGRPLNAEGFKLFNIALEPFIVHRIREGCRTPIFGIDIPQVSKKYSSKLLQEWYNTYKYSINILILLDTVQS